MRKFKYLGTTLTISGGLSNTKEKLRSQANKAYFPMLRALQKINYDVLTSLKLFDSLIKPIMTYNCEFWNQLSKNKIESMESNKTSLEESYFDAPAKKLHLQFCRTTLGVSNKTSSLVVLGELGRYPLVLNCYVQMIKYWHRIKATTPKESLIVQLINYVEHQETQEHFKWFLIVKFILKLCDLEYVWQDPTKIENGTLVTKCFNYLSTIYQRDM